MLCSFFSIIKTYTQQNFIFFSGECLKSIFYFAGCQPEKGLPLFVSAFSSGQLLWLISAESVFAREEIKTNAVYEIGELFELGIQLSYLLILLGLLGVGTFFVIRQVLVRRELDLSAKELQVRIHIYRLCNM